MEIVNVNVEKVNEKVNVSKNIWCMRDKREAETEKMDGCMVRKSLISHHQV